MDLRQMEYFVALAEEQQFTRAAELTMVSQSGLSASIRTLEAELQARLFTRTTRKVELTQAGLALLPHARLLLAQADAGRDAVTSTLGTLTGELRVGTEQCLGLVDVSELLERFHRRYGEVDIAFEQDGSQALLAGLRSGELDVAFVAGGADGNAWAGGLEQVALGSEPLVLVCHPEHPLAAQRRVSWADLRDEIFVDFRSSWGIRMLNDDAFAHHDVHRRVSLTVNDVHTLLDMVQRGFGVALVPRHLGNKPQAANLRKLVLADDDAPRWEVRAVVGASERSAIPAAKLLELLPTRELAAVS